MDLMAVAILTLLLQPLVYIPTADPIRAALGILLVLFSPGYVLVSALYPRREQFLGVERIALAVGLSIALVPLMGLALNFAPWNIGLTPIIVSLSLWILVLAPVAWRRRLAIAADERFDVPWAVVNAWLRKPRRHTDVVSGLVITLAVLAIVGAFAWKIQQPTPGEPFTEFYVLGSHRMIGDYPTNLRVGDAQSYNVGLVNHEDRAVYYKVLAFLNEQLAGDIGPLFLEDGETWDGTIAVVPKKAGALQKLELRLLRDSGDGVYHTVHLFVDVFPR